MARVLLTAAVLVLLTPAAAAGVPAVQAHRGGPVIDGVPMYPEESMPAFENAAEELQVVVELDVKLTSDGVPVVIHDATLDRTTTCEGLVADRPFAELAPCRLDILGAPGNDLDTAPAPVPLPMATLAEVLDYAKRERVALNLEIKNYPTDADYDPSGEFGGRVLDAVVESGIAGRQLILQSFLPADLETARQRLPEAELSALALAGFEDPVKTYADARDWDWVSPAWPVDREYVDDAHARGLKVVPYTINQREDVLAAAEAGVDAVITDDPLMAMKVLDTKAPRITFKVLKTRLAAVRHTGKLPVRVTSDEAATVAFNASVLGRGLGSKELRFRAAGSRKVTFRLRRSVRRALRNRRAAKAVLTGKWRDLALNGGNGRRITRLR